MSFPRYPEYEESGVEWLGEVPAHWEVGRLKYACLAIPSNIDKKSYEGEEPIRLCNYTDVYYNDQIVDGMNFMEATATAAQIAKFALRAGDTIITKDSETADDIAKAAYVPSDLPGVVCGYHLSIVRPKDDVQGAFVKRLFDSHYAAAYFEVSANGLTRVGLGQYAVDNVVFPWPPVEEQTAISAFLERETAKIGALIAEQERLIELLKEKRQAVISQAVTKGLDPDVPMKDSGVEWLGEVPAHWAVGSLGYLARLDSGATPDRGNPDLWGGSIPWVKTGEINYAPIHCTEECITDLGLENSSTHIAAKGTLLMAMYGQGVTRGRVAVLDVPAAYNQACAAIAFGPRIDVQFGRYFFMAAYAFVRDAGNETSQMNLGTGIIRRFRMTVPPIDEQQKIVLFLDYVVAKVDSLLAESDDTIALLKERRAALISAAVTGQIDVRGLADTEVGGVRSAGVPA